MGGLVLTYRFLLPGVYGSIALLAWIDFASLPPDGLANLGLMLVVAPITLLDLLVQTLAGSARSVFVPSGLGYFLAHAAYFWCSASIIAGALYVAGRSIDGRGC